MGAAIGMNSAKIHGADTRARSDDALFAALAFALIVCGIALTAAIHIGMT